MPRPALVLLLALAGCATPIAPSGGPPDRTPPALVGSLPEAGAVRVTGRTVRLTFSERLDPTGVQAVTVTPEGDRPPEVRVSAREIEVVLPELREATTYLVTVGTELRDQRGVALAAPVTVAFATGDEIDRGRLDGVVRDPETGDGAAGLAVWAYALRDTSALPDVRAVAPDYRTGTGSDGAFGLAYLRPGPYFVAAVDDRNRNGRADDGERFAAPPRLLDAVADAAPAGPDTTGGAALPAGLTVVGAPDVGDQPAFWVTARDTTAPAPTRVRTLSSSRIAVRFDEPVRLSGADVAPWTVADSVSGRDVPVEAVYQTPDGPFEVVLQTAAPPAPPGARARVTYAGPGGVAGGAALADSAGNAVGPFALSFTPSDRADTLGVRPVAFLPAAVVSADSVQTLGRGDRVGVVLSAPPPDVGAAVALEVEGEARPLRLETTDGVRFTAPADSLPLRFALVAGDRRREYARLGLDATGALVGRVEMGGRGGAVYVEVTPALGPPVVVRAEPDGRFIVDLLAPGPARLRAWLDEDGDGRWSGGALHPYRPPEPLRIPPEPASVRARWETEVAPIVLAPPPRP